VKKWENYSGFSPESQLELQQCDSKLTVKVKRLYLMLGAESGRYTDLSAWV